MGLGAHPLNTTIATTPSSLPTIPSPTPRPRAPTTSGASGIPSTPRDSFATEGDGSSSVKHRDTACAQIIVVSPNLQVRSASRPASWVSKPAMPVAMPVPVADRTSRTTKAQSYHEAATIGRTSRAVGVTPKMRGRPISPDLPYGVLVTARFVRPFAANRTQHFHRPDNKPISMKTYPLRHQRMADRADDLTRPVLFGIGLASNCSGTYTGRGPLATRRFVMFGSARSLSLESTAGARRHDLLQRN